MHICVAIFALVLLIAATSATSTAAAASYTEEREGKEEGRAMVCQHAPTKQACLKKPLCQWFTGSGASGGCFPVSSCEDLRSAHACQHAPEILGPNWKCAWNDAAAANGQGPPPCRLARIAACSGSVEPDGKTCNCTSSDACGCCGRAGCQSKCFFQDSCNNDQPIMAPVHNTPEKCRDTLLGCDFHAALNVCTPEAATPYFVPHNLADHNTLQCEKQQSRFWCMDPVFGLGNWGCVWDLHTNCTYNPSSRRQCPSLSKEPQTCHRTPWCRWEPRVSSKDEEGEDERRGECVYRSCGSASSRSSCSVMQHCVWNRGRCLDAKYTPPMDPRDLCADGCLHWERLQPYGGCFCTAANNSFTWPVSCSCAYPPPAAVQ